MRVLDNYTGCDLNFHRNTDISEARVQASGCFSFTDFRDQDTSQVRHILEIWVKENNLRVPSDYCMIC